MPLPYDVLNHICDIVAQRNDRATLRSLALVSSQLASHCQRHLLVNVTLSISDHKVVYRRRIEGLAKVVQENSKIGPWIKSLTINVSSCDENPFLPALLTKCTGVEALSLSASNPFAIQEPVLPTSFAEATSASLEAILSSDTLRRLFISGFQMPSPAFFSRCPSQLSNLTVLCKETSGPLPSEKDRAGPPIRLQYLDGRSRTISHLATAESEDGQAVFDFSHLKELSTQFIEVEDHPRHINDVLRRNAPLEKMMLSAIGKATQVLTFIYFSY